MKFKRHRFRKVTANVELTPLVDVVFQLLIFFMLSSTFVVQTSIPIEDPVSDTMSGNMEGKNVTITIQNNDGGWDGMGSVYIDDLEVTEKSQLVATLSEISREVPDAVALIRADANVRTQRLISILELVTESGIEKYGLGAVSPTGAE